MQCQQRIIHKFLSVFHALLRGNWGVIHRTRLISADVNIKALPPVGISHRSGVFSAFQNCESCAITWASRVSALTVSVNGMPQRYTIPMGSILPWFKDCYNTAVPAPHSGISALSRNGLSKQFRIMRNCYKGTRRDFPPCLPFMLP